MPRDSNSSKLPIDALDLFLDGILTEVREPADSSALEEVRAAFRRRIPFNLRSYAAAVLILRAAGVSRADPARAGREVSRRGSKEAPGAKRDKGSEKAATPRPRYSGEATAIFFSMGKRQRLHPRALIDLLVDVGGVAPEDIGEVRTFDNYSFVDLNPSVAQRAVTALNGIELRGRRLSVSLAKRRDEPVE